VAPLGRVLLQLGLPELLAPSPFRVVYGRDPPAVLPYLPGVARVVAVDQQLAEHDEFITEVCDRLEQAQQHYKTAYDKHHRALEFAARDWVWLRLLHRPVASLNIHGRNKLSPKFYGLFRVLERVGEVAYKLELPPGARLHNVLHVGLLKPHKGAPPSTPGVLPPTVHGCACPQPAKVIKGRLARGVQQLLVRWDDQSAANATWVELQAFKQAFPSYQLKDALVVEEGRDVMTKVFKASPRR
jgi:hypothetical protein